MKRPVVDYSVCNLCGSCEAVCPAIFSCNDAGFIDVMDVEEYPEAEVDEAIAVCPEDCICWEDD